MLIIQTCKFHDIERAFSDFGRSDDFSSAGLRVLFEYLNNLSDDLGTPIDLDVVVWCCDYAENTIDDIVQNYGLQEDVDGMDNDEKRDFVESHLQENTIICGKTADGFVYQVF